MAAKQDGERQTHHHRFLQAAPSLRSIFARRADGAFNLAHSEARLHTAREREARLDTARGSCRRACVRRPRCRGAGAASASRATTLSPPPPRRVRERCRGRPARRATANPRLFGQPSTVEDPHAPHPAAPRACMLPAGPGAPRDIARPVQLPHAPPPRGSRASAAARSTPAQPLAICLAISSRFAGSNFRNRSARPS